MDLDLVALIGMLVATVVVSTRLHRRSWPGQPGYEYHWVFSAGFIGLLFLVAGVIGWDLSRSNGFLRGTRWVGGPIWWQIGVGTAFLLLAGFWAWRVPQRPMPR